MWNCPLLCGILLSSNVIRVDACVRAASQKKVDASVCVFDTQGSRIFVFLLFIPPHFLKVIRWLMVILLFFSQILGFFFSASASADER